MRSTLVAALACILAAPVTGADDYARIWRLASEEHDRLIATLEGAAYEREVERAHARFWRDIQGACIGEARKEGISEFRAIAVIDATGTVRDFLPMPESPHLDCYTEQMVGRKYPPSPTAPFYERFRIGLPAD